MLVKQRFGSFWTAGCLGLSCWPPFPTAPGGAARGSFVLASPGVQGGPLLCRPGQAWTPELLACFFPTAHTWPGKTGPSWVAGASSSDVDLQV